MEILLKVRKSDHNYQRYGENCEKYKNSQKPAKRQSDRHHCFLNDGKYNFDIFN